MSLVAEQARKILGYRPEEEEEEETPEDKLGAILDEPAPDLGDNYTTTVSRLAKAELEKPQQQPATKDLYSTSRGLLPKDKLTPEEFLKLTGKDKAAGLLDTKEIEDPDISRKATMLEGVHRGFNRATKGLAAAGPSGAVMSVVGGEILDRLGSKENQERVKNFGKKAYQQIKEEGIKKTLADVPKAMEMSTDSFKLDQEWAKASKIKDEKEFRKRVEELNQEQVKFEEKYQDYDIGVTGQAFGLIGPMWESFNQGKDEAAIGAMVGAGTSSVILPVPIVGQITVAGGAAGGTALGFKVGMAKAWKEQGTGEIYRDLILAGVERKLAKKVADIGGTIYMGVEFAQLDRMIPGGKKVAALGIRTLIAKGLAHYGTNVLSEVGEEGLQRVVTDISKDVGMLAQQGLSNAEILKTLSQNVPKYWEGFKEEAGAAIGPMAILGLPGSVMNISTEGLSKNPEAMKQQLAKESVAELKKRKFTNEQIKEVKRLYAGENITDEDITRELKEPAKPPEEEFKPKEKPPEEGKYQERVAEFPGEPGAEKALPKYQEVTGTPISPGQYDRSSEREERDKGLKGRGDKERSLGMKPKYQEIKKTPVVQKLANEYSYTKETKESVLNTYKEGASSTLISAKTGIGETTILRWARSEGIERTAAETKGITDKTRDQMVDLYKKGNSISDVAIKLNIGTSTVHRELKARGVARTLQDVLGLAQGIKTKAIELYVSQELNTHEIGKTLGVSQSTIAKWMRQENVSRGYSGAQALRAALGRNKNYGIKSQIKIPNTDKIIHADSSYELARVNQLLAMPDIDSVERTTDRISYTYQGKEHTYSPDFLIKTKDGRVIVEETKSSNQLSSPIVLQKAEAAKLFYLDKDIEYRVISESDIGLDGFNDAVIDKADMSTEAKEKAKKSFASARSYLKKLAVLEQGQPMFQEKKKAESKQIIELGRARELLKKFGVDIDKIKAVDKIYTPRGEAAGSYMDALVKIGKMVQKTTGDHEAFHFFADKFADKEVYNSAKKDAIALNNFKGTQAEIDLKAEEWLAENFARYRLRRQGFKGKVRQLYNQVIVAVRRIIGKDRNVIKLFQAFERGETGISRKEQRIKFQEESKGVDRERRAKLKVMKEAKQAERKAEAEKKRAQRLAMRIGKLTGKAEEKVIEVKKIKEIKLTERSQRENTLASLRQKIKDIEAFKKTAKEYASILDKTEKGKLLAKINNIKTLENLDSTLDYIDKLEADFQKRAAITSLKKTIKSLDTKYMRPEYRDKINLLIGDVDLATLSARKQAKLLSLRAYLEEHPNHVLSDNKLNELDRLEKVSVQNMTTADIQLLEATIKHLVSLEEMKNSLILEGRKRDFTEARDEAIENLDKKKEIENDPAVIDMNARDYDSGSTMRQFLDVKSMNTELISEIMDKKDDGIIQRIMYREFDEGRTRELQMRQEAEDFFREQIGDINIDKWSTAFSPEKTSFIAKTVRKKGWRDKGQKLVDFENFKLESGATIKLTKGQKISLFLHSLNVDNRRHLLEGGFSSPQAPSRIYKMTEVDLANITDLDTEEQKVAQAFYDYYNKMQNKKINEVSLELNGWEAATQKDYFGIRTNAMDRARNALKLDSMPEDMRQFSNFTLEGMGALKERTGASNALIIDDVFVATKKSINMASAYYGLAKPLRNAKMLLSDPDFQQKVTNTYGTGYLQTLKAFVRDIEGQAESSSQDIDKLVSGLSNKLTVGILGLNPGVIAKQPVSYVLANTEIDAKYLTMQLAPTSKEIVAKWSPQLRERMKGNITREIGELSHVGEARKFFTQKQTFEQNVIMRGIGEADSLAIRKIFHAAQLEIEDKFSELAGAEKMKKVAKRAEEVIRRTQPTFDLKDRSDVGRSKNMWMRFFTKFTSQRNKNYMILRRAIERLQRGDKNVGSFAKAIKDVSLVTIVTPLMLYAIDRMTRLWRKGRDDREKEATLLARAFKVAIGVLDNNLGNIYLVGTIFRSVKSQVEAKLKGGFYRGYTVQDPLTSVVNQILAGIGETAKGISQLVKDEKYKTSNTKYGYSQGDPKFKKTLFRGLKQAILNSMQFGGIPAMNVDRYFTQPIARLLKGNKEERKIDY